MKLQSIRWQLPLSYAAIAFIATLCLGVVLLTVLKSHYARLERESIESRAHNVRGYLDRTLARENNNFSDQRIAYQLLNFAFLTDTRIQLTDVSGEVIVDTGSPQGSFVSIPSEAIPPARPSSWQMDGQSQLPMITIIRPDELTRVEELDSPTMSFSVFDGSENRNNLREVIIDGVPYDILVGQAGTDATFFTTSPFGGFDFVAGEQMVVETIPRSSQSLTLDIRDENDSLLATLSVAEGPAYGQDIIESVAQGWLVSGTVAVLLAGVAGWIISLRLTAPLIQMTNVTLRMTEGDLSVRTNIKRRDELGVLANAFNEMASRIEDTVTALRQFVADAAHELNTPLTALRTNLELVLESPSTDAIQRGLTQLSRLEVLADDLLDLSRIEAKRNDKVRQTFSINELIQDTSISYASRAEQADIEFELDLPDSNPLVKGDAIQIRRLLSNLLDNAIKFTPAGGVVKVCAEITENGVSVIVEDSGIGIPEADLTHLFMRFHRGRNTNTYPGSGLGLAIVKAIVDGHRGQVHAESNGHGTRITAMLPIAG